MAAISPGRDQARCLGWVNLVILTVHMRCNKWHRYSITSSARRRIEVGNVTPIALAVLRFTVNA